MRKLIFGIIGSIIFVGFGIMPSAAQELGVEEIVRKANLAAYYSGQDGLSDVKMTITDTQGRQRVRSFVSCG